LNAITAQVIHFPLQDAHLKHNDTAGHKPHAERKDHSDHAPEDDEHRHWDHNTRDTRNRNEDDDTGARDPLPASEEADAHTPQDETLEEYTRREQQPPQPQNRDVAPDPDVPRDA